MPTKLTAKIRITERTDSRPDERLFDAWVDGCANVVSKHQMFAMSSHDAIAWVRKTESELLKFSRDTNVDISVTTIFENF